MTGIFNAERQTHNGRPNALGPNNAETLAVEQPELRRPDAYKHEVDFTLDLDLLSPEEQRTVLELQAKVAERRKAKQTAGEELMMLRGADMLTALAAKADDVDAQRSIVEHFVKSTARSMSPEEVKDLEGIINKTFRRIRGLGFRAALAASKRLVAIKDGEIAHRDSTIAGLETARQEALDERDAISADGALYALTVDNVLDNLNGVHTGDTYEMTLIQEAREAVDAALPDAFKVTDEKQRISTGELETMTSREATESPVRGYPQAMGGKALIDALSLGRPSSEY